MRKKILLLFLIAILILPGCWDSKELNDLSIIIGAAVDAPKPDSYEITIQTVKTNSGSKEEGGSEGSGGNQTILSAFGKSLFDASRNISLSLDRGNYWPHTQIVALGQDIAKNDIQPALDFFTRDAQRRPTIYFILSDTTGKEILQNTPEASDLTGIEAKNLIENTSRTGFGVNENLNEFIQGTEGLSGVSLMNLFSSKELKTNSEEKKVKTHLAGTGIFYKNKLVGTLNTKETRAVNWLKDNIKKTIITVNYDDKVKDDVTLEIRSSKTKLQPIKTDNEYLIKAKIFMTANIAEYSAGITADEISLDKLQKKISQKASQEIISTFNKAKTEIGLDLFGFGGNYMRKYPELIKLKQDEWQKIFKNEVELDLDIKVDIQSSGIRLKK